MPTATYNLVQNGNVFDGPDAHVYLTANEGYISVPKYRFHLTGGWGSTRRVDSLLDKERSVVHHGTYSACQCGVGPGLVREGIGVRHGYRH